MNLNSLIKNNHIGIFDSGVGGLSVYFEIKKILPAAKIIYIADTLHLPYGEKTAEQVQKYSLRISNYFKERNVETIVVACSTATSVALSTLQETYPEIPVIGILNQKLIEHTLQVTKNNRIGIIATRLTTETETFPKALQKNATNIKTFSKACPDIIDAISIGDTSSANFIAAIKRDVGELLKEDIDSLILGCTHFNLIQNLFIELFPKIHIISPPYWTAKYVKEAISLDQSFIPQKINADEFYSTAQAEEFEKIIQQTTGKQIEVKKIKLSKALDPLMLTK